MRAKSSQLLFGAAFCALLASAAFAFPRHTTDAPPRTGFSHHSQAPQAQLAETPQIVVHFRVEDQHGNQVRDLDDSQFHLFVDGKKRDFAVSDGPKEPSQMTVVFLADWSGFVSYPRPALLRPAAEFLSSITDKDHCVLAARFSDKVTLMGESPCDASEVKRVILNTESTPRRGPAGLSDAIIWAADELGFHGGYRAIILLSEGEDDGSQHDWEEAERETIERNAQFFFIRTHIRETIVESREEMDADEFAKTVTNQTGGNLFMAQSAPDIQDSFERIRDELHSLYTIEFALQPTDKAGAFHKLKIQTTKKGVNVVAPRSFYVPRAAENRPAHQPS